MHRKIFTTFHTDCPYSQAGTKLWQISSAEGMRGSSHCVHYVSPLHALLSGMYGINPVKTVELLFVLCSSAGWEYISTGMLWYDTYSVSMF